MFRAAAVLAASALMTFAGCTKVDDTLGSNLVPDNQQMKVGYTTLGARTLAGKLDAAKYVETRLFQSDSLKASNISYGYMGSMLSDTFGLRTAGFLTQYLNVYEVKEGYFGYRPIFDSAQILITITSYGNDTLTPQKYNVYEIKSNKYLTEKPVAAGKTERDTVFYLNFDPVKEGVIGADDEPVFTFTFPDGETTGPATTAVTMNTTPATQNFIDRLMLQKGSGTAYEDDYSIYSTDSLKQVGKQFKGFALVFLFRLFLSVAAEIDTLTEHVELAEMLSPALIQELKQNIAFKLCKSFVTDQGDFFVVHLVGCCKQHI